MSLHKDLLMQARQLAIREPKRPKQASLRRAISTAYYALFHLLIDESSRMLVSGTQRNQLRLCIHRAFQHSDMKAAAVSFSKGNVSAKLMPGLNGQTLQIPLQDVGKSFVELQQARHESDYDTARRFPRAETLDLIGQTEQAFIDWRGVRGTIQADTFLTALLVQRQIRG